MPTPTPQWEWGTIAKDCVQNGVATLNCLPAVFSNLVNALLLFVGLIALVIFIIGGFKFMNSEGDPKKLQGARSTFLFGIIGLTIVLLSFLLINLISFITGVKCIEFGQFSFICK